MKMISLSLVSFLFLLSTISLAQPANPEFGNYTSAERSLKECAFDKEAEAVVLLDEGFAEYDDDYRLITTRRIRIKILNQRGIDKGNITIPFYSGEQFEFISSIEGMTYDTESGAVFNLNKKSIYTEKEDSRYSQMRFALPGVKVGSIIEYKYTSIMKHYGGLRDWRFQTEIPTIKSSFKLQILPGAEFAYLISKKDNYPVVITPMPDIGRIYFEMNNIPGLRFEPYMDAPKDYLQRVEFQLSGYTNALGSKQKVNQSWKSISYDLATDKNLGGAVKKNLEIPADLKLLVDKEALATGKAKIIYDYVKNNCTWSGYHSKYATDALKKIWDKRSGTNGEINLILLNFLESFSIESYPLLVADRNYGKVYPDIPLLDRFNKTVAYILADGKTFIADATQKNCPFGLTPYQLLNTFGLIVSKKTDKVINIGSKNEMYDSDISMNIKVENSGRFSGEATINSRLYAKEYYTDKIKDDEKKYISTELEESQPGLRVESLTYDNINNDSALVQHIKFNNQLNEDGGFVLLNYNIFAGLRKSLFTATERFTNVNFGYPYHVLVQELIELPPNSITENLPKGIKLQTPDKDIIVSRQMIKNGNILHVKLEFQQSVTLVPYEDYDGLKEFYHKMVEMLNEPIVIKMVK